MIYLDPAAAAIKNLQLMGDGIGAYTTKAEFDTQTIVLDDHYEMKRNLCITVMVSFVALAIILSAPLVSLAIVAPIGIWISFAAKHANIEKQHEIQKKIVEDIIVDVTTYLRTLRNEKINLLTNSKIYNYSSLQKKEEEIDLRNNTSEIVKLTRKAKDVIGSHYKVKRDFQDREWSGCPIIQFKKICSDYCGSSENLHKSVVIIMNDSIDPYLTTTVAISHQFSSVIFQKPGTILYH